MRDRPYTLLSWLRFADGYTTDARVFSFEGLVDGREHLAFALPQRVPYRRRVRESAL